MEGDAGRGFARLLARLDDAIRNRHCADALDEELRSVLAQFQQCQQAMDHARQVDEATKSLISNAAPSVHVGSPAIQQHLLELQQLKITTAETLQRLMAVAQDRVAESRPVEADPRPAAENVKAEETAETNDQTQQLDRLRSILADQNGSAWLSEAVEAARSVVRGLTPQESEEGSDVSKREYTADEQQIVGVFKLLRKAVVKHYTTHTQEVIAFQKTLKRLLKKRPVFKSFVERCDSILCEKQAKATKNPKQERTEATETQPSKSKKRRLPKTSDASSSTAAVATPIKPTGPTAPADIRSKAQLCSTKANALGGVFSLAAFDVCLKLMIEVVNALSPQFTGDDTALVSATLFVLVDAADKIKVRDKKLDRLVCLESLLSVLLTKERLAWDSTRTRKAVEDHLTTCQALLEAARRQTPPSSASGASSTSPGSVPTTASATKKKKLKPAPSHTRFDD